MKTINKKYFVWLIIAVSAIVYILILVIFPLKEKKLLNYFLILPKVVTVDMIFIFLFSQYMWKWKIFKGWLIPFTDLNGTWKGYINSTWIDPITNERPAPIPVILTIEQNFFNISCVMRTSEMTSYSFISNFLIDKENQIYKLVYSYDSIPKQTVKERSSQHYGSIIFEVIEKPEKILAGEYWTGRKTTGNIELKYWKKEKLNNFPDNFGKHPVSEIRDNKS